MKINAGAFFVCIIFVTVYLTTFTVLVSASSGNHSIDKMITKVVAQSQNNYSHRKSGITKEEFNAFFIEWMESEPLSKPTIRIFSFPEHWVLHDDILQIILKYKVSLLPYLYNILNEANWETNRDNNDYYFDECCFVLFKQISKINYPDQFENKNLSPIIKELFRYLRYWWEEGYESDLEKFDDLCDEYDIRNRGEIDKEGINKINEIGIRILPNIISEILNGNLSLIPSVNYYTDNQLEKDLQLEANVDYLEDIIITRINKWWVENKSIYSLDYWKYQKKK
jgi:hypothetical protein